MPGNRGYAETRRHRQANAGQLHGRGADRLAELIRQGQRVAQLGSGQQQRKLFAAHAGDDVRLAPVFRYETGEVRERSVAGSMPELVVDVLEAIDIGHDDGQGRTAPLGG